MPEPRWLTPAEQQAWRRLAAIAMILPASLDAQLHRDQGLTHFGYWVMAMLSEAPTRSLRMSELAAMANGSQSRLSHLIAKLEGRGWVARERSLEDGRGYLAVLTDAGYDKVVAAAPGHVEEVRRLVFDALTPAQVIMLDEICGAILSRMSPEVRCSPPGQNIGPEATAHARGPETTAPERTVPERGCQPRTAA